MSTTTPPPVECEKVDDGIRRFDGNLPPCLPPQCLVHIKPMVIGISSFFKGGVERDDCCVCEREDWRLAENRWKRRETGEREKLRAVLVQVLNSEFLGQGHAKSFTIRSCRHLDQEMPTTKARKNDRTATSAPHDSKYFPSITEYRLGS